MINFIRVESSNRSYQYTSSLSHSLGDNYFSFNAAPKYPRDRFMSPPVRTWGTTRRYESRFERKPTNKILGEIY